MYIVVLLLTTAPLSVLSQTWALKSNLVTDALLIPTLGVEYALSDHSSVSLTGTYMPYSVGDKKWKNWSVQPELRFVGGLYGKQRQGKFVGGGISAGYHFVLSYHWGLELALGADALYCNYERFLNDISEGRHESFTVLPIGTGISFVYIID